jgi:dihydrolipoamide dehydrogenase
MADMRCDMLIIGGGPGGYSCAIRASQLGIDTVLVEQADLGGTCLNTGCIPSKALIHAADVFDQAMIATRSNKLGLTGSAVSIDLRQTLKWRDGLVTRLGAGVAGLLRSAGVRVIKGQATFRDGKSVLVGEGKEAVLIEASRLVIATGSEPVALPELPFGGPVLSSTEVLGLDHAPSRLAVVGGGYIGLELGTAFAKLGSKVTVVEAGPHLLPQYDNALVRPVADRLRAIGVDVWLDTRAVGLADDPSGLAVRQADGTLVNVAADLILVAVGRRPRTSCAGMAGLGLAMSGPFIKVDARCETSMRGVYAIGDVTGEPMLAHRATAQGLMVAELAAAQHRLWDKTCIPAVCFTDPEIVSVGLTPDEAAAGGVPVVVGQFHFSASGRALVTEAETGFVRIVAQEGFGEVIGVQAVGRGVAELAAGFALAVEMGARLEDVADTIHAHPTLGEGFQEAALKALGRALHG